MAILLNIITEALQIYALVRMTMSNFFGIVKSFKYRKNISIQWILALLLSVTNYKAEFTKFEYIIKRNIDSLLIFVLPLLYKFLIFSYQEQ